MIPKAEDGRMQTHLKGSKGSYGAHSVQKPNNPRPPTRQDRIMMSPDDRALEDLLYGSDLGDEAEPGGPAGAEPGGPVGAEPGDAAADNAPTAVSVQEPMTCAGCSEQVCDRFFLLAAGRVWHGVCLRCSQCGCELQTHPSLYWRDGNIYCQQDYCRMFGGGQCARCFQPIPASALVMRSGELTFHLHCFSCRECDVELLPGNLYCMQGPNLYCQSHYRGDGGVPLPHDPNDPNDPDDPNDPNDPNDPRPKPNVKDGQNQVSGEGEESVSSPEPRVADGTAAGGRARRRTKRVRTCFRSEQLRALESYFAQKHNPDGKDWTCLTHKTGLPKRVLQVWFQNARAKLRRSLNSDDSQVSSPSVPSRGVTTATGSPPGPRSPPSQSRPFPASTIDHRQLCLLTAPLGEPPASPTADRPSRQLLLQSPAFFLDYDSQSAPGCVSSLDAYGDFGEAGGGGGGGGAEGGVDPNTLGPLTAGQQLFGIRE